MGVNELPVAVEDGPAVLILVHTGVAPPEVSSKAVIESIASLCTSGSHWGSEADRANTTDGTATLCRPWCKLASADRGSDCTTERGMP